MNCNCVGPNGACPCMTKETDINVSPYYDDVEYEWYPGDSANRPGYYPKFSYRRPVPVPTDWTWLGESYTNTSGTAEGVQTWEDELPLVPEVRSPIFTQRFRAALPDLIDELYAYVDATFGQHYASADNIQTVDAWDSSGSLSTTCRDTARKYLDRYGKKDGNNPKDLLKTLHYTLMMYFKNHKDQ